MGNRVYVQNPSGSGPTLQERIMSLDADTGKVVWEIFDCEKMMRSGAKPGVSFMLSRRVR